MGAYLSSPICEKDTLEGSNDQLAFAASSMQGWRMSQEVTFRQCLRSALICFFNRSRMHIMPYWISMRKHRSLPFMMVMVELKLRCIVLDIYQIFSNNSMPIVKVD